MNGAPPPPSTTGEKRHFFALPNAWELFGVDAMVTPDNQLVLLEFNPEPSMGMWGLTKKEILKGKCPVTDGVPRSSDERFESAALEVRGRARRGARRAGGSCCCAPPPPPT